MILLDGKALSLKILEDLKKEVETLEKIPHLAVILVGDDTASQIYVNNKKKTAEKIGVKSTVFLYDKSVSQDELISKIKELNADEDITGILVQLPLPNQIKANEILEIISPQKDVDGFTTFNSGRLFAGLEPYYYPCTPKGIIRLLDEYNIDLEGKNVVIVGRSNIVGKPLAHLMLKRNATVTLCHSKTQNLEEITKTADILVSAVGKKVIRNLNVKESAVVIDVGISRTEDGKLTGDVDFEAVKGKTLAITPVPGGIGPMTIASLMDNLVHHP